MLDGAGDGHYKCFGCGDDIQSWQVAEWLGIDWRTLLRPQPKTPSANKIDLDAAPQETESASLSFEQPPDSWLRLLIKFYKPTLAPLYFFAFRARREGLLPPALTRQKAFDTLPQLGCNLNRGSIYGIFNEVDESDNHPVFSKIDPSQASSSRHCKFRLRSPEDMRRRLLHCIRYRVYEEKFCQHRDTLIGFQAFTEALQGSKFEKR